MKYWWQMRSLLSIRSLKLNSIKINYLSGELHTILSIFITHFLNNVITNWSVLYNIFFNIFCLTNLKIKKELKSKVCTYFKNIHGSPRSMYLSRKTRLQCTRYDISKEIDLPVPGYPTLSKTSRQESGTWFLDSNMHLHWGLPNHLLRIGQ